METYPGSPFPLGATLDDEGVNFAIFSENATGIELCLFDEHGSSERRIKLSERSNHIWHIYIPGLRKGQQYGYRVYGPYDPAHGHRFNPNKLLIDPYAREISGCVKWHDSLFGYRMQDPLGDLSFSTEDSAPYVPRAAVIDAQFDWSGDRAPKVPYHLCTIYEAHVKGLTKMNPNIPEALRGTYAGIAHPATVDHLKALGITAIELMPVHFFLSDRLLKEKGLSNYWGYHTLGFFAPDPRYAAPDSNMPHINQFKTMVKTLHQAGIEVILDVVYNHTAEGNHLGPTISFKGIDNASYYRLTEDPRYYNDYTGTGNTLNVTMPNVLRLIMDSLRYWVVDMHVDGFRFDLAAALARELHEVSRLSAFFDVIYQDPVISQVKLIAEPWDVGEGGYQVGKFPPGWAEWNGKYRDCIRDFWRGADSKLGEFAERFTGSSDLYKEDYRLPTASINFICAHDGFTLRDLVSYNEKHNEANGDNNQDGSNDNLSWNCGQEGDTDNEEINKLRSRQQRNLLTTLFLSQGVPMIPAGDELGKTQKGNNNAYCQDNELSWVHWEEADNDLLAFTQRLLQIRREHPVFCRRGWFKGQQIKGKGLHDIAWFGIDGHEMVEENWNHDFARSLAVYFNGEGIHAPGYRGEQIRDDDFYIAFNAHYEPLHFKLPEKEYGEKWIKMLDTYTGQANEEMTTHAAGEELEVKDRSVVVLKCKR